MALLDLFIIVMSFAASYLLDDKRCNYELCLGMSAGTGGSDEIYTFIFIVASRVLSIVAWMISWRLLEY